MDDKFIIIELDPTDWGKLTVKAEGFTGKECVASMDEVAGALGMTTLQEWKTEDFFKENVEVQRGAHHVKH